MVNRRVVTIGPATLILGDAYEERPKLGWQDSDVTDPPYAFSTSGGGRLRKSRTYLDDIAASGIDQGFDHTIINPLLCGSVTVFCHNDQIPTLSAYLNGNFHRMAMVFMAKRNPLPVANKHLLADVEPAFRAWNQGYHPIGEITDKRRAMIVDEAGDAFVENLAIETTVTPSKKYGHPTVKPIEAMRLIVRTTNGQTICDPFMGTGSTGIAAVLEGRAFTGIEKEERHFETACMRIESAVREYEKLAA